MVRTCSECQLPAQIDIFPSPQTDRVPIDLMTGFRDQTDIFWLARSDLWQKCEFAVQEVLFAFAQPYARAATIFVNELNSAGFKCALYCRA